LEQGEATQGVGEVERAGVWVISVDLQSFFVAWLRRGELTGSAEDVAYVADGMGKCQRIVEGAVDGDGVLIMLKLCVDLMQVALDAAQTGYRYGQRRSVGVVPAQVYYLGVKTPGVFAPMLSSRLVALIQKQFDRRVHGAERLSQSLILFIP